MKKFLLFIGRILVFTLLLMLVLDQAYSYAYRHGEPRSKIQNILQLKDKHYSYAFFGSSRTENHIDCTLIEEITGKSCINFGISGGTIGDMLVVMKLAKKNGVTFDKAFLQVDYNYNGRGLSKNFKAGLSPYIYHSIIPQKLPAKNEIIAYSWVPFYRYMRYDKVIGFRELVNSVFGNRTNVDIEIGFSPKVGEGTKMYGTLPKKIRRKNYEILKMRKLYENTSTQLHFFSAPYCPNTENRFYFDYLKMKIPELKNYSKLFDNKPNYFFNCGHLNIRGAKEFTKLLIEDYKL